MTVMEQTARTEEMTAEQSDRRQPFEQAGGSTFFVPHDTPEIVRWLCLVMGCGIKLKAPKRLKESAKRAILNSWPEQRAMAHILSAANELALIKDPEERAEFIACAHRALDEYTQHVIELNNEVGRDRYVMPSDSELEKLMGAA